MVNAGALTHNSWSLHDALAAFDGVVVELHLSNPAPASRGATPRWWRRWPTAPIAGFGGLGYELAVAGGGPAAGRPPIDRDGRLSDGRTRS